LTKGERPAVPTGRNRPADGPDADRSACLPLNGSGDSNVVPLAVPPTLARFAEFAKCLERIHDSKSVVLRDLTTDQLGSQPTVGCH
jgi:hypothetical protein